jgi:6,7-dimethyl-8-ribityllumazine synthase
VIQRIHLAVQARSEQDFELLAKLFDALGLPRTDLEDDRDIRLKSFLPPAARLDLGFGKTSRAPTDLELTLSDPDSAAEIVKRMGLEMVEDDSGPGPGHPTRSFLIRLPGGTRVQIAGFRVTPRPGLEPSVLKGGLSAEGRRFGIVAARFNSFIVERLLSGALDALGGCGVDRAEAIEIVRVPGSFEIPAAARALAETGKYHAIICLGCLLRGETAHYDVIVHEVARGIGQSAQETGVPHAFGVLTCDTLEQAIDRAGLKMGNKGFDAALAAVEMANLSQAVRHPAPVGKAGSGKMKSRPKSTSPGSKGKRSRRGVP